MKEVSHLQVSMGERKVGMLALTKNNEVAFEYERDWLVDGYAISPRSLPLEQGVFIPDYLPFNGLFGIFADSLPDGWGRLLLDRSLRKRGIEPATVGELTRLAIVGDSGSGALHYHPVQSFGDGRTHPFGLDELDRLAVDALRVCNSQEVNDLDALFDLGGSSGGARPKLLVQIDGEDWIIKFPASSDEIEIGQQEYEYALCAAACGISMSEVALFPSRRSQGYFGTKRFDRVKAGDGMVRRIHMASASALLETSHRYPTLDYHSLMRLTLALTSDLSQVEELYRLMCFNVFAHNRDDHAKNFSYLCEADCWRLAPAYDLTYSISMQGEHATTINGEGRHPTHEDLLVVGGGAGLSARNCRVIASEVEAIVVERLGQYL